MKYLETPIAEIRRTITPRWGMTSLGYTVRGGAPAQFKVRLQGETRWRRLMIVQFSNAGSCFVRVANERLWVHGEHLPDNSEVPSAGSLYRVSEFCWSANSESITLKGI